MRTRPSRIYDCIPELLATVGIVAILAIAVRGVVDHVIGNHDNNDYDEY